MFIIYKFFLTPEESMAAFPPAQLTGHDGPTQLLLAQGTVEPPGHQLSNFINLEGEKHSLVKKSVNYLSIKSAHT